MKPSRFLRWGDGGEGSGKSGWVEFAGWSAGGERATPREECGELQKGPVEHLAWEMLISI